MRKLLAMVQSRVETNYTDITLKFTLSALWNLTDESAATCTVFLDQKGAELFLEVLKVFKDNLAIETKVLGKIYFLFLYSLITCSIPVLLFIKSCTTHLSYSLYYCFINNSILNGS